MSTNALKHVLGATKAQKIDYTVEATTSTAFDTDHVVQHIKLPKDKSKIPQIIGWAGPARSGTTSLLFFFASQPEVERVAFQPLKTILRKGGPDFVLSADNKLVCFKEVFRGCCSHNDHDPIGMLLRAGVPPEKITWLMLLRDPVQNYASWASHIWNSTIPENYRDAQAYALKLFYKYRQLGINITPFAYDLLELGEEKVLKALLKKAKLTHFKNISIMFDHDAINEKMAYGQATDKKYFDADIKATLDRDKFVYSKNAIKLPDDTAARVRELCQADYDDFYKLSKRELGL